MIIDAVVTRAVVDGQYGEITVTVVPDAKLEAVSVSATAQATDGGTVAPLALIPDSGYAVATADQGVALARLFAVKPVAAEAGKTYAVQVQLAWKGGTLGKSVQVPVEARPEVYAAIGAVEHLRRTLLGAYESFKQVGKTVHQNTTLPDSGGEPARQALHPETFQWALSMVEMGTKLFRESVPPTPPGTSTTSTKGTT